MHNMEQALVSFFENVAKKDTNLLNKLRQEQAFSVDQKNWCFTLPNLYEFLQKQDDEFCDIDYQQFRKLIFNTPINHSTKLHGAEIIIADNKNKVDNSCYALVWKKVD